MRKIFAVTAILIGSHLAAQDTALLQNVTVTANKYSTKTNETGKIVVVISRQEIERAGSRDLSQPITEYGGIFINGYTNNPGKEKNIYLRGAKVDHTLITIDGIPVYDASGIGSNFDIRYFPIDNVERIEILKGSQSTLYGSDAIAGVINIITRKGGSTPSVSGAAHYGSFNTKRGNISYQAKTNDLNYHLSYNHWSSDGFSEAKKPEGATGEFDNDGFDQNNFQANFGWQASKQLMLQPYFRWSRNKGNIDQDAFTDEKDFSYTARNWQAGIRNSFQFNNIALNVLYQYQHTKRNYLDDSASVNGYYRYNQSEYIAREHFAEVFAVIPFNKFKLTTGADLRRSNTDYNALQKTSFSPALIPSSFSGDSINQDQKSIYASLHFQAKNFIMEGGGRLNDHSEYGSNFAFNLNPSYLINDRIKVFTNISSGYKVPSLYQLFSEYGNKALEPEVSLNYEAGVQYFFKKDGSAIRAGVFKRKVKDVIAFFYDPATFQSKYINQDEQNDKGIEMDAKFYIGKNLSVSAVYSYVDGEITTKQNGKDTSYFNLLRRPKSTLNFSLGYQLNEKLFISTQCNAVGESRDIYFDPNTWQATDIRLKKYFLLNLYAEYKLMKDNLRIFADLRNITDSQYSDIYGYNTAGMNAYGGVRFKF